MTRSRAAPALAQPGAAVTKLPLSRTALPASAALAGAPGQAREAAWGIEST